MTSIADPVQLALFDLDNPPLEDGLPRCQCLCGGIVGLYRGHSPHAGTPRRYLPGHKQARTPVAQFWKYVEQTEGCWNWTGSRQGRPGDFYGRFESYGKVYLAHRFSYELHYGSIPDGLHVLHRCDNPTCTRPDHLFLGSHRDNMEDCRQKGRRPSGAQNVQARLTQEQVREIRARYVRGRVGTPRLAKLYGVSHTTIRRVVQGKSWADPFNL